MKPLSTNKKIFLTIIESLSVFLTVFLNQMIITIFPAYQSVKYNTTVDSTMNLTATKVNCTITDSSNSYVAILIGCKYCTEMVLFPIVGLIADRHHPPLILFSGLIIETVACIVYSATGDFYVTVFARIIDGFGYTLVSTSGLTTIYLLYLRDRPRNRVVTIDSVLVYLAAALSPFVAGYTYESLVDRSEDFARIVTFMLVGPLLFICAILSIPFAFENSKLFSDWFFLSEKETEGDSNQAIDLITNVDGSIVKVDDKEEIESVKVKMPVTLKLLLKDKHIMLIVMALIINSLGGNSLESTLPIFMIRKFCSDQWEQGAVWLFVMVSLLGFFLATFLFHIKPSICWILPLISLFCNGFFAVLIYFAHAWWGIGLLLSVMSFLGSMTEVIIIPMIPKIIDKKYPNSGYGSGSGLTLITFTISGLIGTFPVGPLVDRFGFLTLCVILCVCYECMAPFMFCLRSFYKNKI